MGSGFHRAPSLLLVVCVAACAPLPSIGMSDVSPVWPLPDGDPGAGGFLTASSEGASGVLLPRASFDVIPRLTITDESDDLYASLVVVAARLDPCFREGEGVPPCQPNIRLVLQPVRPAVDDEDAEPGEIVARDASVHAFYAAESADEIVDTVIALARAREEAGGAGGGPLRVNPILKDEAGRTAARDLLLPLLGEDRLVRVTSTGVHAGNTAWTFSGFNLVDSEPMAIAIPLTAGAVEQHVLSDAAPDGEPGTLRAIIQPAPESNDDFTLLLDSTMAAAASPEDRQRAFDSAAVVENPLLNNPGTVDCASCHLAATARATAVAREALAPSPLSYSSTTHDLTPTEVFANSRVVRAFGYRFRNLAVSQRVANESAAVVDGVISRLP